MELFLTVALLHLFAVASPGPDFFLVSRQSLLHGRSMAIWASLGISLGILMHSILSIAGLSLLITNFPDFINFMKYIASAYIAFIGIRTLLSKSSFETDLANSSEFSQYKSLTLGFFTNALNPKAFLFFITVFTLISGNNESIKVKTILGLYMAVATFIWFTFISYSFTQISKREKIKKYLPLIEKIIGFALIFVAIQILLIDYT